jgi:hypothetical protein
MDLLLVMGRLAKFNLGEYNSPYPTIFVEAKDPDEACYNALYKLVEIILKQDDSKKTSELVKDLVHDIRVKKVIIPK